MERRDILKNMGAVGAIGIGEQFGISETITTTSILEIGGEFAPYATDENLESIRLLGSPGYTVNKRSELYLYPDEYDKIKLLKKNDKVTGSLTIQPPVTSVDTVPQHSKGGMVVTQLEGARRPIEAIPTKRQVNIPTVRVDSLSQNKSQVIVQNKSKIIRDGEEAQLNLGKIRVPTRKLVQREGIPAEKKAPKHARTKPYGTQPTILEGEYIIRVRHLPNVRVRKIQKSST